MLLRCDESHLRALGSLCRQDPVFGTLVLSQSLSHQGPRQDPHFEVWLGLDGWQWPAYCLCGRDGALSLSCSRPLSPYSREELCAFLAGLPGWSLEGSAKELRLLAKELPGLRLWERPILTQTVRYGVLDENITHCNDISALCRFLSREMNLPPQQKLLELAPLLLSGQGRAFVRQEGERLVACGVLRQGEGSPFSLLSDVLVARDCRGQGFGKAMVRHLCAVSAQQKAQPSLVCQEEGLGAFYRPLGFEPSGQRYGCCHSEFAKSQGNERNERG